MIFSIALWALLAVADASQDQAGMEWHNAHGESRKRREHPHAAKKRPVRPMSLTQKTVLPTEERKAHDAATRQKHRSFVDRSDDRHNNDGKTVLGESNDPLDTHAVNSNERQHERRGRGSDGEDDHSEKDDGSGHRSHQRDLKSDGEGNGDVHGGKHGRSAFDTVSNMLSLQDGHRAKSLAEREREADAFCSRKDLTQKELDGCRVRVNATKMHEYALHLNDAMRMNRIVKASERVAQRAQERAKQESWSLDELGRSIESRRVARFHDRPQADRVEQPSMLSWILHERKIELALVFLVGGSLVTCVNVYGKPPRPRRRLRLEDHPETVAEPAETEPRPETGYEATS